VVLNRGGQARERDRVKTSAGSRFGTSLEKSLGRVRGQAVKAHIVRAEASEMIGVFARVARDWGVSGGVGGSQPGCL